MSWMHVAAEPASLDPELIERVIHVRRDLHRHPELAYEERRTAGIVAQWLAAHGYQVSVGLGRTGVIGTLARGSSSRAFGFRADMDALPMEEANTFEHRSRHAGKFHGCGHDGHTAMLLGAAAQIARQARFDGVLHLIFQPAEEGAGGARQMIEDGLFRRFAVESVYAIHNMPGLEVGTFATRAGAFLSAYSTFDIEFKGVGGHGAMPHLAVDPIPAAAGFIQAAQTIVSRGIDPLEAAVVSITRLQSGSAYNVIPDSATVSGAVRYFSGAVGDIVSQRLLACAEGAALSHGCSAHSKARTAFPALVNSSAETAAAVRAAAGVVGASRVDGAAKPIMASEDFAFMLQERPGCYLAIGNGAGSGSCSVHNPEYDFNDQATAYGIAFWSRLIELLAPAS
jgi:amidohydrolase